MFGLVVSVKSPCTATAFQGQEENLAIHSRSGLMPQLRRVIICVQLGGISPVNSACTTYVDYDQEDIDLTFTTDMWSVAVARADGIERNTGKCFNCREPGHYWRECQKLLKEDFKCLQEHPKWRQEELNGKGGPGKGGRVPQNANVKPQAPAPAPAAQALQ